MGNIWRRVRRQTLRLPSRRQETDTGRSAVKMLSQNLFLGCAIQQGSPRWKSPAGESYCSEVWLKNDGRQVSKCCLVHIKTGVWDSFIAMLLLFMWLRMKDGQLMNQAPLEYQLEAWVRIPPEPFCVAWVSFSPFRDVRLACFLFVF